MKKLILLLAILGIHISASAQTTTLHRNNDPVIISGIRLAAFHTLLPLQIVGFKFENGNWIQIPIQIDERAYLDIVTPYGALAGTGAGYLPPAPSPSNPRLYFYCDSNTNVEADSVVTFDADDELVFMAKDAGAQFSGTVYPAGVVAGSCQQVTITDTLSGVGYVYLFQNDGTLQQNAGVNYVDYRSNVDSASGFPANNNVTHAENTRITTAKYSWHFASEWVSDELRILIGNGADILDRHKAFFANGSAGCGRHEGLFSSGENAYITCKKGPIRVVRSYMGAQSGPLTQRTHFFYEGRHDIITNLRVHAIPSIYDAFDYNSNATGMIYRNDLNTTGVTINGLPDTLITGAQAWEQVSGVQGTLSIVYRKTTNISPSEAAFNAYYDDNSAAPASNCTGTNGAWGTSGVGLTFLTTICTDCYTASNFRSLELQKIVYADSATAPATTASTYSTQYDNPLQISIAACQTAAVHYTVALSSAPTMGGAATGGGSYQSDSTVVVTATANSAFSFLNWTENGVIVSDSAIYSFRITGDRTLEANFGLISGIADNSTRSEITVYPNPTKGLITVANMTGRVTHQINVYNALGQLVQEHTTLNKSYSLSIENPGLYEVVIISGQGVIKQKVVVTK